MRYWKIGLVGLCVVMIVSMVVAGVGPFMRASSDEEIIPGGDTPLGSLDGENYEIIGDGAVPLGGPEMRGVWVCSVYNMDFPSKTGQTVTGLKKEVTTILDRSKDIGFNAVFLQVRPNNDALYPSKIYPWSQYLTGTQGVAPADGFDPLLYWIDEAHKRGLELHAWINPYRATRGSTTSPKTDVAKLAANNPARLHPDWVIAYTDGSLYYDPGRPEVRKLIVDGVTEIVTNYNVDGIHFDDYFYPGTDFKDSKSYAAYGKAFKNISDWRRNNVDQLIQATYNAVKAAKPNCAFGVSPFAIWANKENNSLGSDTRGGESYYEMYADTRKWVKSEWLDYICPQIYWNIGYRIADYEKILKWWVDVVKDTPVSLYVGHAGYRVGDGTKAGDVWHTADEIIRQFNMNRQYPLVRGSVMFRYDSLNTSKDLYNKVKAYYNTNTGTAATGTANNAAAPSVGFRSELQVLAVGRPSANITTTLKQYYLLGTSDPDQPLYYNGKLLTNRSAGGSFGVFVTLDVGKNTFTFKQDSQTVTRTITRAGGKSMSAQKMNSTDIVSGSLYPNTKDEYVSPGEIVPFRCTAPIGATVTVTIDGQTFAMVPEETEAPDDDFDYPTDYTYDYTLPSSFEGAAGDLGSPVFTMTKDGVTTTKTATAVVRTMNAASYYAEVTSANAYIYPGASTSGGPIGELAKGQKDTIVSISGSGSWAKLSMGGWVQMSNIKKVSGSLSIKPTGTGYVAGLKWDIITFTGANPPATTMSYDGKKVTLTLYSVSAAPVVNLSAGSIFASVTSTYASGKAVYTFTPKTGVRVEGYNSTVRDGNLTVYIKRPVKLAAGDQPLSGLTIVLDAGHGGSDPGAIGPAGNRFAEKHINLSTALMTRDALTTKGATVVMTRDSDVYLTLDQRVEKNRAVRPDLFLSLHSNSVDDDMNAEKIIGISTWYRNNVSKAFSASLYETMWSTLGRNKRLSNQQNLYVCRPTWTPSVILEVGFICNPGEFEWLASPDDQQRVADAIVKGVVKYFS